MYFSLLQYSNGMYVHTMHFTLSPNYTSIHLHANLSAVPLPSLHLSHHVLLHVLYCYSGQMYGPHQSKMMNWFIDDLHLPTSKRSGPVSEVHI